MMKRILLTLVVPVTITAPAMAHKINVPEKTLLTINPGGSENSNADRLVFKGQRAKFALYWIAEHGIKPTNSAGLFFKGKVYKKKTDILNIAKALYAHRFRDYWVCNRKAPEELVAAVTRWYRKEPYISQSVKVSFLEGGWRTDARNGQYQGTFQMGSGERARWGHGGTFWAQARASSRYFFASGADWSPWEVKPWWPC